METKNHFVVAAKKNSKLLYKMVEQCTSRKGNSVSYNMTPERGHGRVETRKVHVFNSSEEIKQWCPYIESIVRIERTRTVKNQETSKKVFYYVSDLKLSAKKFAAGIRNHWLIENKLHWVKDVIMNEDKMPNKNKNACSNISLLKTFAIQSAYCSGLNVTNFINKNAHNIEQLLIYIE